MNSKGKFELSKLVTLDFETYYSDSYTLSGKTLNTSEYIRSPEFKVHCVGIKVGRAKTKWYDSETAQRGIQSIDWSTHDLLCQNTAFDGLILSHHYGVVPRFYYDTLSMSRALHGVCMRHDLGTLSKAYGRQGKIEGALVKTKGKRELTEGELEALAYYCCNDVDETYEIFRLMQPHFPKDELELIDLTIRMFCDPVLQVDTAACERLKHLEIEEKERLIELAGVDRELLNSADKFAARLREYGIDPPIKISLKTGNETYAFAKSDPEFEALLDHEDHRVVALAEARLAVKSTIDETRAQRFINAGTTGNLPVGYNYCGAHTHRWSGSNKLNCQNLPRGGELRRAILAPKGHQIVVADSSNIELRVNAWLAGHNALLDIVRAADAKTGPDPYCVLAGDIYGRTVTKNDALERFVGKTAHLGLGYGMGAKKFQTTLLRGEVELPADICRGIVSVYRKTNAPIPEQWKYFDSMLARMLQGDSDEYGPDGVLRWSGAECPTIWLPNGLGIYYPGLAPTLDQNERITGFSYVVHGARKHTWGGTITENVVQSLARHIIAHQMLKVQKAGYRVVMMTHDEIICLAPNNRAEECLATMFTIMKTPPPWAKDLPLNAEGGFDSCYSK